MNQFFSDFSFKNVFQYELTPFFSSSPMAKHLQAVLNEKQKTLCSKMNNFFCGLHLLVGLADSCEESLKKFERQPKKVSLLYLKKPP
jgi:oligoribonuclease (3'-5' exoribonuclease)